MQVEGWHAVAGHGVARHSVARGIKGWHVMARHGTVCGGLVGSAMQCRCRWKGGSGAIVGSDGRGGARSLGSGTAPPESTGMCVQGGVSCGG